MLFSYNFLLFSTVAGPPHLFTFHTCWMTGPPHLFLLHSLIHSCWTAGHPRLPIFTALAAALAPRAHWFSPALTAYVLFLLQNYCAEGVFFIVSFIFVYIFTLSTILSTPFRLKVKKKYHDSAVKQWSSHLALHATVIKIHLQSNKHTLHVKMYRCMTDESYCHKEDKVTAGLNSNQATGSKT